MDHQRAPRQCHRTTAPGGPRMLGQLGQAVRQVTPHQRNRSCRREMSSGDGQLDHPGPGS